MIIVSLMFLDWKNMNFFFGKVFSLFNSGVVGLCYLEYDNIGLRLEFI